MSRTRDDAAHHPGQGDRAGADAGRDPPGHPPGAAGAPGRPAGRQPVSARSTRRSAASARSTALKRVLLRESQVQPLLLVFEDLHWIDTETQALLDSLVESLPTAQLLLLVNYRPEYQHGWGSKTYYTQLRLDPLPPASADEFLQALLGDDPSLAPLKQLLIARTEGNPFFLEESVRTLVETGVLVGEPGAYRLAQALPSHPGAGHGAGGAGGAHRPAAAGGEAPPADGGRHWHRGALAPAAGHCRGARGGAAPRPGAPAGGRVSLRDAPVPRAGIHLQACPDPRGGLRQPPAGAAAGAPRAHCRGAGERSLPERVAEQVERLAHHALRGEVWDKAVTYCQQAGARAYDRAAFREAVAYFEQALQALAHLPEHGDTRGLAIDLRLALATPLRALGEYGRCLALLGEAEALARALDDRARLGRVLAEMAQVLRITGDLDGAMAAGQQALELAAALGDSALQVQASYRLGQAYFAIGDFGRAAELLRRNVEAADREAGTPSTDLRIRSQAWLARTLARSGPSPRAGATGRRHSASPRWQAAGTHRSLPTAASATCTSPKGTWTHAIRVLEQGLALCRASGNRDWLQGSRRAWAMPLRSRGASRRGAHCWRRRSAKVSARARWRDHFPLVAWLSEVCRLAGRGEEAWQHARQALDLARQQKARGDEALALHQLGVVHAHADPPDVAAGRSPLPAGPRPGRRTRHAPARRPTATSAWARCMSRQASGSRPAPSCPPPSSCIAPWR